MQITKGYAPGRWGQIHYAQCGSGIPLLLSHQSPTDIVQFARVMAPLARQGLRPIAIDLPGFGGSDLPDAPPGIADYAHIVPAVLDHLGLKSASVLGHHTGAVVVTASMAPISRSRRCRGVSGGSPESRQLFLGG